ncbi:hypothetical protein [Vibrio taketomensis]
MRMRIYLDRNGCHNGRGAILVLGIAGFVQLGTQVMPIALTGKDYKPKPNLLSLK